MLEVIGGEVIKYFFFIKWSLVVSVGNVVVKLGIKFSIYISLFLI